MTEPAHEKSVVDNMECPVHSLYMTDCGDGYWLCPEPTASGVECNQYFWYEEVEVTDQPCYCEGQHETGCMYFKEVDA